MSGRYRKLDPARVLTLKRQGLSNAQIALRLGATNGAISQILGKHRAADGKPAKSAAALDDQPVSQTGSSS